MLREKTQREARRRAIAFPMPPLYDDEVVSGFFIERAIVKGIGGEAVKAEAHALTLRRL
jgi:hypothetical protein